MKKIIAIMMTMMLVLCLTACGGSENEGEAPSAAPESSASETAESPESSEDPAAGSQQSGADTLVVYFSATGTTKGVAEKIAKAEGADIYEIKAAQEYTDADLDWNDDSSRTTKEQSDKSARPKIGSDPVSLDGYSTIYIGYPIWWGEEPMIMDTFVESCDFDGKTVIPFCTSGGSGIGSSGDNLAENAGSGTWLDGDRLDSGITEDELENWIEGLK